MNHLILATLIVASLLSWSGSVHGKAVLPVADVEGSADHPALKRYEGSFILSSITRSFDEFVMPLSRLEPVAGATSSGARRHAPQEKLELIGRYNRIVYLMPQGRSPLEVFMNYKDEIGAASGDILYQCKEDACGGDQTRSIRGIAGKQSLAMYLFPSAKLEDAPGTNSWCAVASLPIGEQRYMVAKLGNNGPTVSVLLYVVKDKNPNSCGAFNGHVVAVVDIIEDQAREKKMVTVSAEEMAVSLASEGTVILEGIFFENGKAVVQPTSDPALQQVAKLMTSDSTLQLLVVGHTDNVGSFESNRLLSAQRAQAVVKTLGEKFGVASSRLQPVGVSFAAPKASNSDEIGRSKNRRVELVKRN